MYVLLVRPGTGFIEMPRLDVAKSNKSGLSSLVGCLFSDVGCDPRPEDGRKGCLQAIWGGPESRGRDKTPPSASSSHSQARPMCVSRVGR